VLPSGFRPAVQDATFGVLVGNSGTAVLGICSCDTDGSVNVSNVPASVPTVAENVAVQFVADA
jgi:hypothetical protein